MIALVAAVFIGIMTIGILAAIAIPAFQEYTIRAKVAGAEAAVRGVRGAVEQYIINEGAYPGSNADVGLAEVTGNDGPYSLLIQEGGVIILKFGGESYALVDKTVIFTPVVENDTLNWDCRGGTLERKYRSRECR
jgi:type IV pilus assembly protein PilA